MIHAVLGTGPCPAPALIEALKDALDEGDEVVMPWVWPIPDSLETVYSYVLDNEVPFILVYSDDVGKIPTKHFRDSDFGALMKSRDPISHCIRECSDSVLYLWDDNESLLERIYEERPSVTVLELSNGLTPILVVEPASDTATTSETAADDGTRFSKPELESMAPTLVKRYGEKLGCSSTSKDEIIEELFPSQPESAPVATIILYDDGTWKQLNA